MAQKPLADRMRPRTFDEIAGQSHLVGKNGILRRLTNNNRIPNMIFFGPPGTGKTTVANIAAKKAGKPLYKLNATTASTADIKEMLSSTEMLAIFPSKRHRSRKMSRAKLPLPPMPSTKRKRPLCRAGTTKMYPM